MPIFNPEMETMDQKGLKAIQLEKLKRQVKLVYDKVDWYKKKFDEIGITPDDIQTLDDVRKLPFTDKTALRDTFPYGLFAVPLDEVIRLHASSGTTGKPIVVGYNRHDMEVWTEVVKRMMQMAGVNKTDRVQMAFGYGMFTGGFGLHQGAESLGCMVIPAGSGQTERQIQMIEDYGSTVLVSTPSYAMHVCEVGESLGYDWAKSTLRIGLFGGEPCPPSLKNEIESRMHITCTDNYGLTEIMGPGVSGECLCSRDMQHISDDMFLAEIIDPETGELLPEGSIGELVLTPLDKQAIPVIRYRTHDLTYLTTEKCECGRTTTRMEKVRSRCDDMLIIRGTNVFPSQIEDVLAEIEGASTFYRLAIDNDSGLDRATLMLEVEPDYFFDEVAKMDSFRDLIAHNLREVCQVSFKIRLMEPGSIERVTGKTKHVVDNRNKD